MPRYLSENADAVQMRSDKFLTERAAHGASAAAKYPNKSGVPVIPRPNDTLSVRRK